MTMLTSKPQARIIMRVGLRWIPKERANKIGLYYDFGGNWAELGVNGTDVFKIEDFIGLIKTLSSKKFGCPLWWAKLFEEFQTQKKLVKEFVLFYEPFRMITKNI